MASREFEGRSKKWEKYMSKLEGAMVNRYSSKTGLRATHAQYNMEAHFRQDKNKKIGMIKIKVLVSQNLDLLGQK